MQAEIPWVGTKGLTQLSTLDFVQDAGLHVLEAISKKAAVERRLCMQSDACESDEHYQLDAVLQWFHEHSSTEYDFRFAFQSNQHGI